jgi:hypothetical protein
MVLLELNHPSGWQGRTIGRASSQDGGGWPHQDTAAPCQPHRVSIDEGGKSVLTRRLYG